MLFVHRLRNLIVGEPFVIAVIHLEEPVLIWLRNMPVVTPFIPAFAFPS